MNRWVVIPALAAMLVSCKDERPATPVAPARTATAAAPADLAGKAVNKVVPLVADVARRCEVGSSLDAQGAVTASSASIAVDAPLYLTIWLAESPADLQVSMRVYNSKDEEVALAAKDAKGARTITLALDRSLAPGSYRVQGIWGGNVACEQDVEIAARP